MAGNPQNREYRIIKREEKIVEWIVKFLRGIGIGFLINLLLIISGSFKGTPAGQVPMLVLACFLYGIGFSFGLLFLKLAWKKTKSVFRRTNTYISNTSGNIILTFAISIAVLILGVLASWIIGIVLCVVDIIFAFMGKKLLSTVIEVKFGYKVDEPEVIDNEAIIRSAVTYNYQTHGNADAGAMDATKGYTPTAQEVEAAVQRKKNELGYWE